MTDIVQSNKLIDVAKRISYNLGLDEKSKNRFLEMMGDYDIRDGYEISENQINKLLNVNDKIKTVKDNIEAKFPSMKDKFNSLMTNLAKIKLQSLIVKSDDVVEKSDLQNLVVNQRKEIEEGKKLFDNNEKKISNLQEENNKLKIDKDSSDSMITNILDMVNGTIEPIASMLENRNLEEDFKDAIEQRGGSMLSKINTINKYLVYKYKYIELKNK